MAEDLYEADFYTWTQRQAEHLRERRFDLVDLANVVEEIETLGRSQASALQSAYRLIAMHLLKLMVQPQMASNSWRSTVVRERVNVEDIIDQNPGLKPQRPELFLKAYGGAVKEAASETGLSRTRFPVDPPFTVDEVEDEDFWPKPSA